MTKEYEIRVEPRIAYDDKMLKDFVARENRLDVRTITAIQVIRRSIDARQKFVRVNMKIRVYIGEKPNKNLSVAIEYKYVGKGKNVIVVGEGPAGLFAALRLIELGYRPIIVERGKNVHERKKDIAKIKKMQMVDPESNYSFGEGGAGAYSDGKLYTRSKKRGSVEKILQVFCHHGASENILIDAHPHIGTDKLPRVIENMRETIIRCGGHVYHNTKMVKININNGVVTGIVTKDTENGEEKEFDGPVILATGHSARDVYRYLNDNGIEMEAKGIAVGVRLEHPSHLIDCIQYHSKLGRGQWLPAAEYSFVTQVEERGVYSFCMCPGGFVVPAATDKGQIVVNGMSPSTRDGRWSNSGIVVETRPEDIPGDNALKIMTWQEELEKECWLQGNMKQTAPAQRMADFINKKLSYDLPKSSYTPGLISSPLHFWLPASIATRLRKGLMQFGKSSNGFLTNEAVMIAIETRTSAPVRILRDSENLMHVRVKGLFPCGEGAGYAGGIVSAAIDGERCAEMCAAYLS